MVIDDLRAFSSEKAKEDMRRNHKEFLDIMWSRGAYVWGAKRLGKHTEKQLIKNGITFLGYIDNDVSKQDGITCFAPDVLKREDAVIIASALYDAIARQMDDMDLPHHLYYEDLAVMDKRFDAYFMGFDGIQEELEENRKAYIRLYYRLEDEASKEVLLNLIKYRISQDIRDAAEARKITVKSGSMDFDDEVVKRIKKGAYFFDIGAWNGNTTERFIDLVDDYKGILILEPDKELADDIEKRFCSAGDTSRYHDISVLCAAAGAEHSYQRYEALGNGAGLISENGTESIEVIALDDYIDSSASYVKVDVEGYESEVIRGMEKAIKEYAPILGISVYHKPGDLHRLVEQVLGINPNYKVYLRHYTNIYADTICYFIA